jgi:TraM recognition site of TraD and TraG/Type IV secretion-system coupling protein DNA-binding domain
MSSPSSRLPMTAIDRQVSGSTVDPLEPLEQLAHRLLDTTTHVILGLLVGLAVAHLMRRRHLHWSWVAGGPGLALLAYPALGDVAITLGVATLGATVHGRRWQREDLSAGLDLAELAVQRHKPLDALRAVVRLLARHRGASEANDGLIGEGLIIGHDEGGRSVSIPLGGATSGTHTLVVGATGSGKTVSQTSIATRAIEQGRAAVVLDPKGDSHMRGAIEAAARIAGRPFIEWTPAGESVYNPYAHGSETEIADKILAGEYFTEPHYLRQAQRYLGHAVRALRKAEIEVSLPGIVDHLDPTRLELLVRELPEPEARSTYAYLDSLTPRQRSDLAGVRDRLAIMAESDIGCWLDPNTKGAVRFELFEAVRARAVVYFNLEADRRPLLAQMLGAAIVQDLQTTAAALQGRPIPTLVVIDEFSAVAAEQVVRLFGRARAAGMSLLLGTQELSDLRLPGRETLQERIMGNLSTLIAHRQVVPASAELIAQLAGTRGAWRTSQSSDGRSTRTRTLRGRLQADEITGLPPGYAAIIVLAKDRRACVARILSTPRG